MTLGGGARLPLRDRLVVADGASAALAGADGTVDWWCPGRVDRPPLLWRLLDPAGAAVRIGPVGRARRSIAYVGSSLTPRCVQGDDRGAVAVSDVVDGEVLLRVVEVLAGEVDLEVVLAPGRAWRPSRRAWCAEGVVAFDGWALRAPGLAFGRSAEGLRAACSLVAGERLVVALQPEHAPVVAERDAFDRRRRAVDAWGSVARSTLYEGPAADAVRRSCALLAAVPTRSATTSLPAPAREELAADHRHAFVADGCSAWHLLGPLGHRDVAASGLERVERALERGWPPPVAVDVDGEPPRPAQDREGLAGWRGAPVREGWGGERPEVDLEVAGALATVVPEVATARWAAVVRIADEVEALAPQVTGTADAARCWALLDAAAAEARRRDPLSLDAVGWHAAARALTRRIEAALGAGTSTDPRLLRLTWQGPLPSRHELVAATVDRVLERRSDGPFVVGEEGPSTTASWWAVRALARLGRWEEAHARADLLLAWTGPAALLPRSADPVAGRFAGDLPGADAHLALVAAALELATGPR